jgi:hypothetical protein
VIHLVLHTGFDHLYHLRSEHLLETMRCKSTYNNCEKTANSGDHQKKSRHNITFKNTFCKWADNKKAALSAAFQGAIGARIRLPSSWF